MKRLKSIGRSGPPIPDMGSHEGSRQGQAFHRPIVAFDFDGTLTVRDSFKAFLAWRAGPIKYALGMTALAPNAASFLIRQDRGRLKAAAARQFFKAMSRNEIESDAVRFAELYARRLLRPDAVRVWKLWQARGARLVIVTASPEIIVAPFARGLGAEKLLGTPLEFDADDRFTGQLGGINCRGAEKVRRLRAEFGDEFELEAAYGDTGGDREMLALAHESGFRVFNGKP